ncbi:MAG: hypothetical protein KBD31_01285 [Proteobacteria bacterium]|nr:hypothetical protein [Pseudomonadota bacterium]
MSLFNLKILKYTETAFEGSVLSLYAPIFEGDCLILKGHAPFIAKLKKGTLKIQKPDGPLKIDIEGGFLDISEKCVSLVVV